MSAGSVAGEYKKPWTVNWGRITMKSSIAPAAYAILSLVAFPATAQFLEAPSPPPPSLKEQALPVLVETISGKDVVDEASGNGANGHTGNSFMDLLLNIPEVAEIFKAKVEALSGDDLDVTLARIGELLDGLRQSDNGADQIAEEADYA